jgi:DNA polymerase
MLVLIDGDSLIWRSISYDWEFSYGFIIKKILDIANEYNAEGLIVIWDGSSERRKVIYPEYKAKRQTDDELVQKKENLKSETISGLELCGIVQCRVENEEGDDVIATMVQNLFSDEQILLCSNDKDFYSLLSDKVKIFNWKEEYDEFKFRGEFNINPSEWVNLRSMMGDTSDNIKGIHGIGPKKGLKIIQDGDYDEYKDKEEVKFAKKLLSFFDIDEEKIVESLNFGSIDEFKIKQMCEICRMKYEEFSSLVWKIYESKRMRRWRLDNLEKDMEDCSRCKLVDDAKNVVCWKGDMDSKILFIGEAPGENEDSCGRPFVGDAGRLLDIWIEKMGLDPGEIMISNTVWHRPVDKYGKNKKPTPKQIEFCSKYGIDRLIKYLNPEIVIALGEVPASYMMGSKVKVTKEYGKYNISKFGIKFILWVLPHPASLLYGDHLEGLVHSQLIKLKEYLGYWNLTML